jgi:site-specific recombinase XerC
MEVKLCTNDPISEMLFALKSPESKRQYPKRLKVFMDYLKLDGDISEQAQVLLKRAFENPKWLESSVIGFIQCQMQRVGRKEIVPSTIQSYIKSLRTFLQMNDFLDGSLNWRKIRRGLPPRKDAADDRPPTKEEIKKLIEYPDRRIKVIVYVMLSSGIRVGAWDYLNWKHVRPHYDGQNKITAARLLVYGGEPEQYTTFITPEAYKAVAEWMDFRSSFGEKITVDSPLMRDSWQTTNVNQRQRLGLATHAKRLKSSGVKRLLERALWEQGIRQPLENGKKRHEWKAAHGFRKFYETTSNTAMRSINVAWTMGHSIGISESYYKPTEDEVLKDYLNAVPKLTINDQSELLNEELCELRQSTADASYVVRKTIK